MPDNDKYLFVDEQLHLLTGREAEEALRARSDAAYLDQSKGVVTVPKQRWREAQTYERDTWLVANAGATDDRNVDHAASFGDYAVLAGRTFHQAIELGCGPFTNLRLIAGHCAIERCSLVDPLIDDYLRHPHCTYDHHALQTGETRLSRFFGRTLAGRALRRVLRVVAPGTITKHVLVAGLLPFPIEEMPVHAKYDLCVMINVLEHCFDADAIFEKIAALLEPGGLFVFHDKLFDERDAAEDVRRRFDAGHPLRVGRGVTESFLAGYFTQLYRHDGIVSDEFEGIDLSRDGVYFIGARK